MTIPATLALRTTLVARLKADAGVADLVADRIYDHVPEREQFPYVSMRAAARAWDTTDDYGKEITVEFNAWSRAEGRRQCELILHAVDASLRTIWPAVLTDHRLVNMTFEMADVLREEGGQTYFGYARYRAVTEEL